MTPLAKTLTGISPFASLAYAENGSTCCDLMREALRENSSVRSNRPKGLRRRAVVVEDRGVEVLILYAIGKTDAVVSHCPFCGTPQAGTEKGESR